MTIEEQIIGLLTNSVIQVDDGYGGSYDVIMADTDDVKELAEVLELFINAEVKHRIAERFPISDEWLERIVQLYYNGDYKDQSQIAKICDEALDRSGALLGVVRDKSSELRSSKKVIND